MGFFKANKFIKGYRKLEIGLERKEVLKLYGKKKLDNV